jgi:hypothetical protein
MTPNNQARLLNAAHRWAQSWGYVSKSATDTGSGIDRFLDEVDGIIADELAHKPREVVHAAVDRGIDALIDRVLGARKR